MTSLHFWNPESFNPADHLTSPELVHRLDDARYAVSLVATKMATGDVDHQGYVRLHGKFLRNIMYQSTYNHVMDALVDAGVLKRAPYRAGVKSFGYRLADRFSNDRHVLVPATDTRLIEKLEKFYEDNQPVREALWLPVHHALAELQHRLTIDGDAARAWLAQNPDQNKFGLQGLLVSRIENGMFSFNVGDYDRVTNSITNLKRELRRFLRVDGLPLWHVDLRTCQPALLAQLVTVNSHAQTADRTKEGNKELNYDASGQSQDWHPDPYDASRQNWERPDVVLYRTLTESGELYDFLLKEVRKRGHQIGRERLKDQFMCDVVAKRGRYPARDVERVFNECFPTIRAFIRAINRDGREHKNLIRQLQREEARFVIGIVAADLVTRFPGVVVLPLHDALYVTAQHLPKVVEVFNRAFDRTGIRMSFKVKDPEGNEIKELPSVTTEPMVPGKETTDAKTPRRTQDSDHGRGIAVQGPELVSVGLGVRWPRLEAA